MNTISMGLFDNVMIEHGVKLPDFPSDNDHTSLEWQTKDIGHPSMNTYKITEEGKLMRKEVDKREMTQEELDEKAQKKGYESWDAWEEADTSFNQPLSTWKYTVDEEWWVNHNMHGSFEFHASGLRVQEVENYYWSFEARYTNGKLQKIVLLDKSPVGDSSET